MIEPNPFDPPLPLLDRNDVRAELIKVVKYLKADREARDFLIRRGAALGIGKVELAELAGVSRQTVYYILAKREASGDPR